MSIAGSREQAKEVLLRFVEAVTAADEERDAALSAAEELREEREGYLRLFQDVEFTGDTIDILDSVFAEDEKSQRHDAEHGRRAQIEDAKRRFLQEWKAIESS